MKSSPVTIINDEGKVYLFKKWVEEKYTLDKLICNLKWRDDRIKIFGNEYTQARKVAWYGDENIVYTYSGITMRTEIWTSSLTHLRNKLEMELNTKFNSVLINLYRDGRDYMGWHADDEKELGMNPTIASLSFGSTRDFCFKHKVTNDKKTIELENRDLIVMKGETQKFWKHSIPKRLRIKEPRLNLTFRYINSL